MATTVHLSAAVTFLYLPLHGRAARTIKTVGAELNVLGVWSLEEFVYDQQYLHKIYVKKLAYYHSI